MRKIVVIATFDSLCNLKAYLDKEFMEYLYTKPRAHQGEYYKAAYVCDLDVMVAIMTYLYYHERKYAMCLEYER